MNRAQTYRVSQRWYRNQGQVHVTRWYLWLVPCCCGFSSHQMPSEIQNAENAIEARPGWRERLTTPSDPPTITLAWGVSISQLPGLHSILYNGFHPLPPHQTKPPGPISATCQNYNLVTEKLLVCGFTLTVWTFKYNTLVCNGLSQITKVFWRQQRQQFLGISLSDSMEAHFQF